MAMEENMCKKSIEKGRSIALTPLKKEGGLPSEGIITQVQAEVNPLFQIFVESFSGRRALA